MPPLPRAVVFDLDGTLVDSLEDLAEATNRTLVHFGLPAVPLDVIRTRIGHGARNLVAASLGEDVPLEPALEVFIVHYRELLTHRTRPFPGLEPLLDRLGDAGIVRAVATNKPADFTTPILRSLALDRRLEGWASGDESERKPSPASVHLALERAGAGSLLPEHVVYVGDMPVDVATARSFGARAVAVSWGFDPDGCRRAEPDAIVASPEELAAVLGIEGEVIT